MTLADRPSLAPEDAAAVLVACTDPLSRVSVSLLLLAGLRPGEVEELRRAGYDPAGPALRVGTVRYRRTIAVAPSVGAALDGHLSRQGAGREEHLLPELRTTRLGQIVRSAATAAGVDAGEHELRPAAIRAVLEDGTPMEHVIAYFGMARRCPRKTVSPLRPGWDAGVGASLEAAFVA